MTRYEQEMFERDIPGIRDALKSIANSLKNIEKKIIVSDPGDEVEHIMSDTNVILKSNQGIHKIPDDYKMD